MGKMCAIKSCSSGRTKEKKKSLLSFFQVKSSTRLKDWTNCLGVTLKASDYICQMHFKVNDIKMYDKIIVGNDINYIFLNTRKLKENALPTIEHQDQLKHEKLIQVQETSTNGVKLIKDPLFISDEEHKKQLNVRNDDNKLEKTDNSQLNSNNEIYTHFMDPLNVEKQEQKIPIDYNESINDIKVKIRNIIALPAFWCFSEKPKALEFIRINIVTKKISHHIRLNEDLSVTVICPNDEEIHLGEQINSAHKIHDYLKSAERWPQCSGTQVESRKFSKECKGVIVGNDTYVRNQANPRCKSCRNLRKQLLSLGRNLAKQSKRLKTT